MSTLGDWIGRKLEAVAAEEALFRKLETISDWPALSEIKTIKHAEGRAVYRAQSPDGPVVIKQFTHAKAAETVEAMREELDHLSQTMQRGPYRMMRALAIAPEQGIILLEHVPGVPISEALERCTRAERATLLKDAGAWLNTYVGERRQTGSLSPAWWIKKAKTYPKVPNSDALVAYMEHQISEVRGYPITSGAAHGDFIPSNLHVDGGVLWGVDVQGRARLPLVRELAHFLLWTERLRPLGSGPYRWGVAEADLSALTARCGLPQDEISTLMPFFIAEQLLRHSTLTQRPRSLERNARIEERFLQAP